MNKLKDFLRCPLCLSVLNKTKNMIVCSKYKHQFGISQGIPILLDFDSLPIHSQEQQIYFEKALEMPTLASLINMDNWKAWYLKRFIHNFKEIKNKSVIEIGTGSGYMAIGLAKLGAKVMCCDLTISNLIDLKKYAKTLKLKNMSFVCCSADKLPFLKSAFDYFIINAVLEHIPNEKKVITEINRILKRGGGLMITVPMKYKYIFPPLLLINYLHDKRFGHLRRYDDVSLKTKFRSFQIKRCYFTGHPLKVIKVIINMIIKIFDEKTMEEKDAKLENIKRWSSNLIAFLYKR